MQTPPPTLGERLVEHPLLDRTIASTARDILIVQPATPPTPPPLDEDLASRSRAQSRQSSSQDSFVTDSSASAAEVQLQSDRTLRAAGAQADLGVEPVAVEEWNTFWDDVEIENQALLDIAVTDRDFPTQIVMTRLHNESEALLLMRDGFVQTLTSFVFRNPIFRFSGMMIDTCSERGNASFRTDMGWTRQDRITRAHPEHFGVAADPSAPFRRFFLVHEHKKPYSFPYLHSLPEVRREIIADFKADRNGDPPTAEELKQAVAETIENTAEENLVTFWRIAKGQDTWSEKKKRKMVYPIVQIYCYMLRTFCKYGVLSTTDRTWFLKLTSENKLLISRPFSACDVGSTDSVKFAYFSVILRALDDARLDMNHDTLRTLGRISGLNVIGSAWAEVYHSIFAARARSNGGSSFTPSPRTPGGNSNSGAQHSTDGSAHGAHGEEDAGATGASARTGPVRQQVTQVTQADKERAEALLRKTLPLPAEGFTYHGGLVDVVKEYPEDFFGRTLRVCTRGVDTIIKVMRQLRKYGDPSEHDEGLDAEEAEIERAFEGAMDAYEVLRPIQGKHVPWFLYGGPHILGDVILATTYEGELLSEMSTKTARATATKAKARAALDAVHALGVAHRAIDLTAFAMDDAGDVRLVGFLNSVADATQEELAADDAALEKAFSR